MPILYKKTIKAQTGKKIKKQKQVGDLGKDSKGATRLTSGGFGEPYSVRAKEEKQKAKILKKKKRQASKNKKFQTGGPTTSITNADLYRQEMSEKYGNHLAHLRAGQSERSSPYYKGLQRNPLFNERNANEDWQSFKPGYFEDHYGPNYFDQVSDNDPTRRAALIKQYDNPTIAKSYTTNSEYNTGGVEVGGVGTQPIHTKLSNDYSTSTDLNAKKYPKYTSVQKKADANALSF